MPIRNYGLHWRYGFSGWGRVNSRGKPINFSKQIGIYVLEKNESPVYVGRALTSQSCIASRLDYHFQHVDKKGKWNSFSWFGFLSLEEDGKLATQLEPHAVLEDEIKDIEALLVYLLNPPLNKVGGDHRHIARYEQCPEPE
jgi:hypothetical protein